MALKGALTFLEMVARLTRGFIKETGKQPDNLAKLKINMEAAERIKQQNVVTEFPKDRITPFNEPRPEKGEVTPIKKFLDDDVATAQINKLKMDFDFSDRNKVLQLLDDIDSGKAFGAFDDVQKKELRDMISTMYTRKPDFASGGLARVGMAGGGRIVKWLLSLGKKPKINRKLTKDELDDLYEEFDEAVPYPMKTVEDKEKFLKAVKDEEAYMFQQYKKGNLDPKPGEPNRKRFLEKKLEEMEMSGDKKLMTIDEIEELSSFDLGTEMDEAIKKYKQKDIQQKRELQAFDVNDRTKQASGGMVRVGYAGGKLVKGAPWFIKNLRQAYDELVAGKAFTNIDPMKKELLRFEILAQIKNIEKGGPIPKDMINAMRKDKRFKDITKTRSTDPELYDVEEILLNPDVDQLKDIKKLEQKEMLEQFDVTDRTKQASGGIAGQLHLNRPGYFVGNLVKLLKGGKNVYRGTSTGGGTGGHFHNRDFLKGKFYTTDKKLAEMYASWGKGILGVKKKTLSKKELEKAKRIGKIFHEEIILPKKLAKEAEIDIPSSIKVNIKKLIKDIREGNAEGGIAGQLHLNQGGRAGFANGSPAVDPRMLQSYEQNKAENEAARLLNQASRSSGGYTDIYNKYFKGKARQGSFGFQEGRTSDTLGTYHSILNKDRDQIIKDMAYQMQQEGQNTAAATALKEKQAISQQQKDEAEGKRIEAAITGAYGLDTMEGKKYALEAEMLGMPTAAYMDYVFTGNPEGIAELGGTGNEYINPYNVYYSKELKRQQAGGIPAAQQIQYGQVMAPPWSHTQQSTAIGLPPGVPGLMGPGGSAPSPTPSPMYIPYADALSSYKQQYQTMNQPFTIGGYGAPNQPTYAEFQRQWGSKGGRIGFTGGTGGNTYQDFLADKTVRPHPDDKSWRDVFYRWLDKQRANQAKGGRIGYAEGTKKLGEGQYSPTKDKAWMQTMPKIDPNLRKLMEEYKKRKGLAEILGV